MSAKVQSLADKLKEKGVYLQDNVTVRGPGIEAEDIEIADKGKLDSV